MPSDPFCSFSYFTGRQFFDHEVTRHLRVSVFPLAIPRYSNPANRRIRVPTARLKRNQQSALLSPMRIQTEGNDNGGERKSELLPNAAKIAIICCTDGPG